MISSNDNYREKGWCMSGIEQFSGFEVVRAAMEVEKNGHRFYSTMAQRATHELARELFSWLAQDEVEHLRRLKQVEVKFQESAYFADDEEFLPYLRRFSDQEVFPSAERLESVLQGPDGDLAALALAIEAEDKFAAYFAWAAEHALEPDGREAFAWLAAEEIRHGELLRERQERLTKR
jgi:rubrerythrin